jgi:hypothetical protein
MDKKSISREGNFFGEIHRAAPKWIIDRVEEGWAVLENPDTRESFSLPMSQLPKDAKPGSTLVKIDSKWYVNEADTAARSARIKDKFSRLKR